MKGTVKLNSVAEEEKSKLVVVLPAAPDFAAAMAAPRPRPFPHGIPTLSALIALPAFKMAAAAPCPDGLSAYG